MPRSRRRDPLAIQVGRHIREARELRGWSQRDLAALLGTSESRLSKWENGFHVPPLSTLVRLARQLKLPLDLLIPPPAPDPQEVAFQARLRQVMSLQRDAALVLLDTLLGMWGFLQTTRPGDSGPQGER